MFFGAAYLRARQKCSAKTSRKKNPKGKKKTRQTCKHFHGYSTQFAQRAWLHGNIQNGLYLHSRGGGELKGKDGGRCGWEKDSTCRIWNRYANVVRSARFLLSEGLTWSFDFRSSLPPALSLLRLFHWLRWWCTYCLLVNMIKIQISHYGKLMWVCVCRVEM